MKDIQSYFDYHRWATERLCEMLSQIDENKLEREMKSSFPGIKATLAHLAWAEELWLNRILGKNSKMTQQEWGMLSVEEVSSRYLHYNEHMLRELKGRKGGEEIIYTNTKGVEYRSTITQIGMHLVNHGSYHRGQIVTLLHQNKFSNILAFDFIAYLRT